jgi:hypothetical protein
VKKRINAAGYDVDKARNVGLLDSYQECFESLTDKEIKLLELGVLYGASLKMWRDYFEKGIIVGLDLNVVDVDDPTGRIRVYQGSQRDTKLLDRIAYEQAPEGFDVVIDDCSHIGRFTRTSFWHLFDNHLKPGGIYVIEDYGTGYMDDWPDGKGYNRRPRSPCSWLSSLKDDVVESILSRLATFSPIKLPKLFLIFTMSRSIPSHNYGMAGFVKELIDACCLGEIVSPNRGSGRYRPYKIQRIHIFWNHVIVFKSVKL